MRHLPLKLTVMHISINLSFRISANDSGARHSNGNKSSSTSIRYDLFPRRIDPLPRHWLAASTHNTRQSLHQVQWKFPLATVPKTMNANAIQRRACRLIARWNFRGQTCMRNAIDTRLHCFDFRRCYWGYARFDSTKCYVLK